jgi:hypothetical protein
MVVQDQRQKKEEKLFFNLYFVIAILKRCESTKQVPSPLFHSATPRFAPNLAKNMKFPKFSL